MSEMKVWDEEWTADAQGYLRDQKGDCIFIGDSMGDGSSSLPERARLAAQAPAMARFLRALMVRDDATIARTAAELRDEASLYLERAGALPAGKVLP